jgi:energy-coupling factor transporter ATP-binding protein EcfA2
MMIDYLAVENLRSIESSGKIELAPITILVGHNGSGKSTLLRTLPFLRQSAEVDTRGPFLWFGPYVDYGSFESVVTNEDVGKIIKFCFHDNVSIPRIRNYSRFGLMRLSFIDEMDLTIKLGQGIGQGSKYQFYYDISMYDFSIQFSVDSNSVLKSITVNDVDMLDHFNPSVNFTRNGYIPRITSDQRSTIRNWRFSTMAIPNTLLEILNPFFHGKTSLNNRLKAISRVPIGNNNDIYEKMFYIDGFTNYFFSKLHSISSFKDILPYIVANRLVEIIEVVNALLHEFSSSILYSYPVRAQVERYYRFQDLAVDEVDFRGQNLAMFLQSLTRTERENFKTWTKSELGFSVKTTTSSGHVSIQVSYDDSNYYNITDMGFGFGQIMPIIAQLWSTTRKKRKRFGGNKIIAIEQPELHLHPQFQGKLADLISSIVVDKNGELTGTRVLLETHSQSLVNGIGKLISEKEKINKDIVNIVLFELNNDCSTNIKIAKFDNEGYLNNWPYGFLAGI